MSHWHIFEPPIYQPNTRSKTSCLWRFCPTCNPRSPSLHSLWRADNLLAPSTPCKALLFTVVINLNYGDDGASLKDICLCIHQGIWELRLGNPLLRLLLFLHPPPPPRPFFWWYQYGSLSPLYHVWDGWTCQWSNSSFALPFVESATTSSLLLFCQRNLSSPHFAC